MLRTRSLLLPLISAIITVESGCTSGPDYRRPEVTVPAEFRERPDWKQAEPRDHASRNDWWEIFGDGELSSLLRSVEVSNQNVAAARAAHRQALAALEAVRASYYPAVGANALATRAQGTSSSTTGAAVVNPGAPIRDTVRATLSASWEADLWGRIDRAAEASGASAQASAADVQSALLSARATLTLAYIQVRIADAQKALLDQAAIGYERSLTITRNRYEAGVAQRSDVTQAETQLRSTRAQAIELGVQRAQLEHAIAVLQGKSPAEVRLPVTATLPLLPVVPAGVPSELLERRPDIAAAERRVAAANAQIGVAQAAIFPTLTLGASTGYQSDRIANLLSLPNRFWSLGPTLAATIFDAGLRSAQKAQAIAGWESTVAAYRQTVLVGFQEVEDNLSALRVLAEEEQVQRDVARFAAETLAITNNQYLAGTVSYLNVVTAQATSLAAERSVLDLAGRRLLATVALLKALGGDWKVPPG